MESNRKTNRAVMQLLADAKNLLGDNYGDDEFKKTFLIIKTAKERGFLGADKSLDICLADCINAANDILRFKKFEEIELEAINRQPRTLYVYVALVAIGLIPA